MPSPILFIYFQGLNVFFHIITISGFIISVYGILQHFFGIDVLYHIGLTSQSATYLGPPLRINDYLNFPSEGYYQIIGVFQNHIDYGIFFQYGIVFPYRRTIFT